MQLFLSFFVFVWSPNGRHGPRRSQQSPWNLGISVAARKEPCVESLRNINVKDVEFFEMGRFTILAMIEMTRHVHHTF